MKFLIRYGSELRVVTMWHCSDGKIYIEGRYVEQVDETVTGSTCELESVLKHYCTEFGYEYIGILTVGVNVYGT